MVNGNAIIFKPKTGAINIPGVAVFSIDILNILRTITRFSKREITLSSLLSYRLQKKKKKKL